MRHTPVLITTLLMLALAAVGCESAKESPASQATPEAEEAASDEAAGDEGAAGAEEAAEPTGGSEGEAAKAPPTPSVAKAEGGDSDPGAVWGTGSVAEGKADGAGSGGLGMRGGGRGGGGVGEASPGVGSLGSVGKGGGGGSGYGKSKARPKAKRERAAGGGRDKGLSERKVRTPKVLPGKAEVRGSLDKDIIRRVVRRHRREVQYCYERELMKKPDLQGKIDVKFVIDPKGKVATADALKSTMGNRDVERCVTQKVRRWRFPEPKGGGVVVVNYPFVFSSGDSDKDPAERERLERERRERERKRREAAQARAGKLTAGEWRDLDHWEFWRGLFVSTQNQPKGQWGKMVDTWGYDTGGRIKVEVTHSGKPLADADVVLQDANQQVAWQTKTDVKGRANLFTGMFGSHRGPFTVLASSGKGQARMQVKTPDPNETLSIALKDPNFAKNALDVMFVVDTTGSMGDELSYLQAELKSVVDQVQSKHGQQLSIRTSVNFYRDQGDDYVVRPFPFSETLSTTLKALGDQYASGGGDFPEAVEEALEDAVDKHQWRTSARARLLFFVLDAPPHQKPQIKEKLHRLTRAASAKGIRIIPVGGSGINKDTEFLMRFLAIATGGTYVFLTDHSGVGNSHIKPTIGPHKVEQLNALLTRVVNDYL